MRPFWYGACVASVFLVGGAAEAATVEPIRGELLITHGQGYHKVNSRIEANVGDALIVGPGGEAAVTYPDGCRVMVEPGSVVDITPLSPCGSRSYYPGEAQYQLGELAIGAAILGGATAFAIYEFTRPSSQPKPASP